VGGSWSAPTDEMKEGLRGNWLGTFFALVLFCVTAGVLGGTLPGVAPNVHFETSCPAEVAAEFDAAVEALHSFWYEESLARFSSIKERYPDCIMAYWGTYLLVHYKSQLSPYCRFCYVFMASSVASSVEGGC